MAGGGKDGTGDALAPGGAGNRRAARLGAALRQNLLRRKVRARSLQPPVDRLPVDRPGEARPGGSGLAHDPSGQPDASSSTSPKDD